MSQNKQKLYEGKAKILYKNEEDGTLLQYFKDDATAFNAQKRDNIYGKGILNNVISAFIMQYLEDKGIKTHFIKRQDARHQHIREVEIIPIEVVVRNYAAGTLVKRYGLTDKKQLPIPLVEFCYKDDALGDPLISREHAIIFGWAKSTEISYITGESLNINELLKQLFQPLGIVVADFKLEFGRLPGDDKGQVILADEISPDSCRFWNAEDLDSLDKDRFRQDMGNLVEAYKDVANRLGLKAEVEAAFAEES